MTQIRRATLADRESVYKWMTDPDIAATMFGPPLFPETPTPTWEEFRDDYVTYFFDGSRPDKGQSFIIESDGEAVGHISYSGLDVDDDYAELDIWLSSRDRCRKGIGPQAICLLVEYLAEQRNILKFKIRPSVRNTRAIRAYEKAGFQRTGLSPEDELKRFGPGDHDDVITLTLDMNKA